MLEFVKKISQKKEFVLASTGDSMLPILQTGDFVYYRKVKYQAISENDILLIHKGNTYFTHRVIYKTDRYLITRGDNNAYADGNIYPRNILGRAVRLRRDNKIVRLDELYVFQSLLYFHEIARIIASLKKAGVETVILKGLPLHLSYEGKRPKRIYFDCDILVSRKDDARTAEIFKKNGYRMLNNDLSAEHRRLKDKKTEDSYVKLFGNFPVVFDIHYEAVFMMTQLGKLDPLYPQHYIDSMTDEFLRGKKDTLVQGTKFPLLSEKHLVPYLMLHFFHHNFKGTFRLSLIHEIIKKVRGKTSLFREIAGFITAYHLQGYTYPGFLLLEKYYQTGLPPSFIEAIRPPRAQLAYIRKNILSIRPFDGEGRIEGGIMRFKQLFYLSPGPVWKKSMVFLNPSVWYSVLYSFAAKYRKTAQVLQ